MQIDTTQVPKGVRFVAATLRESGHKAWIVGGCVRDLLRGQADQISDWDLTTNARPEEVTALFKRVVPTGLQHGTVTVMHGGIGYEVTTLRGEGAYSDGRRPDEVFFVDNLEEDLARRDFTVNAIAADPVTGEITDPFGGLQDLRAQVLRAVGDANERFSEDGLRVLRAARFCAVLRYELEADTEDAIRPNLPTFSRVARERVLAEWVKAVEKSECPSVAFEVMRRTGILELVGGPLGSLDQNKFLRAMVRLDRAWCFEHAVAAMLLEAEASDSEILPWLRDMKMSNAARDSIIQTVRGLRGAPSFLEILDWSPAQIRRWASKIPTEAARSDVRGVYLQNPYGGSEDQREAASQRLEDVLREGVPLELKGLAVSGGDLQAHLGIGPSRQLGLVLKGLLEFVLDDPTRNQRETLLSHASTLL